jgi:glycosyltransferase involved in cell wall biosynthesis
MCLTLPGSTPGAGTEHPRGNGTSIGAPAPRRHGCGTKRPVGTPVAIDVTPLVGVRTGIGNAVAELIRSFATLKAAPSLVPYALSLRAREHRGELPPDTRFPPIPARALLASWGRRDSPKLDHWLRPARVLHATNYLAPPSKLPVIVTINDCSFARYPELCTPEVRALAPVVRRSIRRGAVVHVPSAFVANEVDDLFGPGLAGTGRLVVVPWGVPAIDTASETPPELAEIVDGPPYVLAIGSLEPRKNLPYLVAAFGAMAGSHPGLRLVLAGPDGPARPAVDTAVSELADSVRARVVITGGVSDAGRVALLAHANVLAYPSLYEGFGFPVLEAMSIGVPVVAARAGSIPEVAGDAATLVGPTDVRALADALAVLVDDSARRAEQIALGHDQARRYSWRETAHGLAALYRRLASS